MLSVHYLVVPKHYEYCVSRNPLLFGPWWISWCLNLSFSKPSRTGTFLLLVAYLKAESPIITFSHLSCNVGFDFSPSWQFFSFGKIFIVIFIHRKSDKNSSQLSYQWTNRWSWKLAICISSWGCQLDNEEIHSRVQRWLFLACMHACLWMYMHVWDAMGISVLLC